MPNRLILAVALLLLIAACASTPVLRPDQTPLSIDLARYTGTWYEIARTPNRPQEREKERNGVTYGACRATRAIYSVRDADSVAIQNICRRESADGRAIEDSVTGIADRVPGSNDTKFRIAFGSWPLRVLQRVVTLGGASYWIHAVGDAGPGQPYPWAVVSGPDKDYLFLLAREPNPPAEVREQMLAAARGSGLPVGRLIYRP